MEQITVQTQLSLSDFEKLNYHLIYRKFINKAFTGIGIFLISLGLLTAVIGEFHGTLLVMGVFFVGFLPFVVKMSVKRNYNSNSALREKITYSFEEQQIQMTGESFNSTLSWEKVYRVTESKNWVLIWQSRQIANAIHKRAFSDEELLAFRHMVESKKGLKKKLMVK